jgi:hypothetical protein
MRLAYRDVDQGVPYPYLRSFMKTGWLQRPIYRALQPHRKLHCALFLLEELVFQVDLQHLD